MTTPSRLSRVDGWGVDGAHDVLGLHGVGPVLSRKAAAIERAVLVARDTAQRSGEVHEAFTVASLTLIYDLLGERAGLTIRRMLSAAHIGATINARGPRR